MSDERTRPYCSQPDPIPAATLKQNIEARESRSAVQTCEKVVSESTNPTHTLSRFRDQSQKSLSFNQVTVCEVCQEENRDVFPLHTKDVTHTHTNLNFQGF